MTELIIPIICTVVSILLGSIIHRIRKMEKDIESKISKKDVRELIQDKLEIHTVQLDAVKEDVEAIIRKLDKLISAR